MTDKQRHDVYTTVCRMLPYGVKYNHNGEICTLTDLKDFNINDDRLVLRRMQDMTDAERKEYEAFFCGGVVNNLPSLIQWLDSHYLDFFHLTETFGENKYRLALVAPHGLYDSLEERIRILYRIVKRKEDECRSQKSDFARPYEAIRKKMDELFKDEI